MPSNMYSQAEIDAKLANMYTKTEIDAKLAALTPTPPTPTPTPTPTPPTPTPDPTPPPSEQYLFQDEFDGPAGSAPDPKKWTVANWGEPQIGGYRNDRRNLFVDGKSNLVIRATYDANDPSPTKYWSAKIQTQNPFGAKGTNGVLPCLFSAGINTIWEARIKFDLRPGTHPAWWMLTDQYGANAGRIDELDIYDFFGNYIVPPYQATNGNYAGWPPAAGAHTGTGPTIQSKVVNWPGEWTAKCHALEPPAWHTYRTQWDLTGFKFWRDFKTGDTPQCVIAKGATSNWAFNDPGFKLFAILNNAIGDSAGGSASDLKPENFPVDMLVDWVRVWAI